MKASEHNIPGGRDWTPTREKLLLLTLAAIQFTTILDFVIIIPLGPQYISGFHIVERQFGLIVSAYGIAAGISGLAAGFFLDRFDRKKALVWLYLGFTMGTLFCAMSPTYPLLVASRFVAGMFGGVVGALILSIVGDVIPMERRGAAMGLVMSAFSVSSIVGVPLGLMLADAYSWHIPFYALAVLSALVLAVAIYITPSLRDHLQHATDEHPVARTWRVMMHPDHRRAYLFMAVTTCAGFMIFPYIPVYLERNAGLGQHQLKWLYVCGGLCTVFSMNWVGRWSDRSGKLKVFTIASLSTAAPILLLTNLPRVPLWVIIVTFTLMMICMSARMVPAMAMMTGAVAARDRGGFMSINSSVQQISMALTAYVAGAIIGQADDGRMTHFPINGLISIFCAYSCIYLARFLRIPKERAVAEPAFVEMG
jgi:predicted MFS family arabinose efflux permease